ncbi:MAG: quinohemoprotein amine dehydrogenase subunit alpha [Vicinamibacterales bacterium]
MFVSLDRLGLFHATCVATFALVSLLPVRAGAQPAEGIPVTDPLVVSKCGTCHPADDRGRLERISWARATPEGWQEVLRRKLGDNGVSVTPVEARAIVKYLSTRHGLAPEESKPVMYYAERRVHDELGRVDESVLTACATCHEAGRALAWRRPAEEWKRFVDAHSARYKFEPEPEVVERLATVAPFATPEWTAWSARAQAPHLAGRWLVTARARGRGAFCGEMDIEATGTADEYLTRVRLRGVSDATPLERSGRTVVYAGTAWRGRSSGAGGASLSGEDLASEAREAMWVASDATTIEGRWFWGQYQELGLDVTLRRASTMPTLLLVEPSALKAGTRAGRVRLIGDGFPAPAAAADLEFGAGVTLRRVVSSTPNEIVVEVDVASDARSGTRDVAVRSSRLENVVAIFDRVDYVQVTPESSLATFGDRMFPLGVQQFDAIGYQRGPDGRSHTADDLELGPIPVTWSMDVFYEVDQRVRDRVGTVNQRGFFTPAGLNPGANYDVWIVATTKTEKNVDGKPLVGKGYLVVTVPTYTFNGRTFVRELDRWVEDRSGTR